MRSDVDEILERADIVDVVSQYVKLRRQGKNFLGLCPFHKEKTPSFTVSSEKQIYYCFGCHQGGNVINFVMNYDRLTFQEAIEQLASQYGIKLTRRSNPKAPRLVDAVAALATHYQESLKRTPQALDYLRRRGITDDTVNLFGLGYGTGGGASLGVFLKRSGIPKDVYLGTGIIRVKGSDVYDMFRGRIIIPIRDINGKIIAFGGRAMSKDALPKYINSPESPVFAKRSTLFGLDKAKREIAEKNEVFIVEGYFDFITLFQAGLKNVVATLGTSVTEEHLAKIRNYTEHVTLMLDGDEAGVKSALRLIPLISEMDLECGIVVLPDGHDPDSFVRKEHQKGIDEILRRRRPLLDFCFEHFGAIYDLRTLEGRMAFVRSAMPHVREIRSSVKRRLYVNKLSELTGVEEQYFYNEMEGGERKAAVTEHANAVPLFERRLLGALLSQPRFFEVFEERGGMELVRTENVRELLRIMRSYFRETGRMDVTRLVGTVEIQELRDLLVEAGLETVGHDEDEASMIIEDFLVHEGRKVLREKAKSITEKLLEAEKKGDEALILELLQQKRSILALMQQNTERGENVQQRRE